MLTQIADPTTPIRLRRQAEARLQVGTAPLAKVAVPGVDALAVIHRMAGDPENASAALKLLHELQVHQVELDLQHEQLEQTRDELSRALDQYVERYDFAPVGLIAVDRTGRITEGNRTAAAVFAVEPAALIGRHISSLVSLHSQPNLLALLARLCSGSKREICEARADGAAARPFRLVANIAPSDQTFMMAMIETSDFQ